MDPGLDRHAWESEWESLQDDVRDDPTGALPSLREIVHRMLGDRGLDGAEVDPELRAQVEAADEAVRLLHEEPDALSPGDVAAAIEGYRSIYETLLAGHAAP